MAENEERWAVRLLDVPDTEGVVILTRVRFSQDGIMGQRADNRWPAYFPWERIRGYHHCTVADLRERLPDDRIEGRIIRTGIGSDGSPWAIIKGNPGDEPGWRERLERIWDAG